MRLRLRMAFIGALIAAFVFAQTPALAKPLQQVQPRLQAEPQSGNVKTVVIRLDKNSRETPEEVAAELRQLSPDEVALLAANPDMMNVGGLTDAQTNNNIVLIIVAAAAVIIVIVVVAVVV